MTHETNTEKLAEGTAGMTQQQDETFKQFNTGVDDWRRRAEGQLVKVNVIAQRNNCVLRVCESLGNVRRALDIGCGTGDLVLELASRGVEAEGIDFAPEMIKLCEDRKLELGARNSLFACQSILDISEPAQNFDLISGMGLIEYISPDQLQAVVELCAGMLRPGGALVLSSRNRLFNVFSLNEFTTIELELGVVGALLAESVEIASATDMATFIELSAADHPPLPHPSSHPSTSVNVNVRYQYTPGEVVRLFGKAGLKTSTLFPIHYHPMPPAAKDVFLDTHTSVSNAINDIASEDHRLIPNSSTFAIDGRKP